MPQTHDTKTRNDTMTKPINDDRINILYLFQWILQKLINLLSNSTSSMMKVLTKHDDTMTRQTTTPTTTSITDTSMKEQIQKFVYNLLNNSKTFSTILVQKSSTLINIFQKYQQKLQINLSSSSNSTTMQSLFSTTTSKSIALLVSGICIFINEKRLQNKLTQIPNIYGQITNKNSTIYKIYDTMKRRHVHQHINSTDISSSHACNNNESTNVSSLSSLNNSIITRPMRPLFGIGTHAYLASAAAYFAPTPPINSSTLSTSRTDKNDPSSTSAVSSLHVREVITLPSDGTKIVIEWELPPIQYIQNQEQEEMTITSIPPTNEQRTNEILNGPIQQPIILIVHGINNDSTFGYIRSLMRTCTNHGWIAAGYNFRGHNGVSLQTPRGFNGAYTGDIRSTIQSIAGRLDNTKNVPIFIIGCSLGANLVTKYLGEEGYSQTLLNCIAGGITYGNPMSMNASKVKYIPSAIITVGAKIGVLKNLYTLWKFNTFQYRNIIKKLLFNTITLKDFDTISSSIFIRNNYEYPYEIITYGYSTPEDYWTDCSSSNVVPFINIPFLQLISCDDFLVHTPHYHVMNANLNNPNVMVIETAAGGHLGWQEVNASTVCTKNNNNNNNNNSKGNVGSLSSSSYQSVCKNTILGTTSWADAATAQFIQTVLDSHYSSTTKATAATTATATTTVNNDDKTVTCPKDQQQQQQTQKIVHKSVSTTISDTTGSRNNSYIVHSRL